MAIDNFEDWEQRVLDRRLEIEKSHLHRAIDNRKPPKSPPTLFALHFSHGLKVVAVCLVLGAGFLFVVRNLSDWFAPLIEFIEKAFEGIMG